MFKMKKEFYSQIETESQHLLDLKGCSSAFIESIEESVKDLEEINTAISERQRVVEGLINELTMIKTELNSLRNSNTAKIEALKAAFGSK